MNELQLLERLHDLLRQEAAARGDTVDRLDDQAVDLEVVPMGRTGVMALINGYVLAAWPPEEQAVAAPMAFRQIHQWLLERGVTRHMIHPANFRSVKVTRRLGAKPVGYDRDGYMHYELTLKAFEDRHNGKEVAAPEGA